MLAKSYKLHLALGIHTIMHSIPTQLTARNAYANNNYYLPTP